VDIDGNNLQGNEQRAGRFALDNYTNGEGFTWAATYDWQRVSYDIAAPYEFQRAQLEFGVWLSSSLRIFASGGVESDWDVPLDPALQAELWEGGFSLRFGTESTLTVASGERSFGSSSRVELNWQGKRQTLNASYVQEPTTQGLQRVVQPGPSNPDLILDLLTAQGQSQRFISNRGSVDYNIQFSRLTLRARLLLEERTDITSAIGTVLPDQEQSNAGIRADYQLGARTRVRLGANRIRFEFQEDIETDILSSTVGLSYDIGPRSELALDYTYVDQESVGAVVPNRRDFISNSVVLTFRREFR
ncbi:MAG: hypothetical protein AAGC71_18295, partial [Pseudomonadota bacterium]